MSFRVTYARFARVGTKKNPAPKRKPKGLYAPGRVQPGMGESAVEKQMMEVLRPMPRPPPRSEEEREKLRALMIRYGKHRRAIHLIHEGRRNAMERAKAVALDALPNYRRIEALTPEPEPLPVDRPLWTHTPPIKGFNAADLTR